MKRINLYIKILVLGWIFVPIFCSTLFAGEDSARLKAMIGKVEYLPTGAAVWQAASEGLKLSSGDTIKTGADGLASIVFTNGSEITLKPNTDFKIISLSSADETDSIDYKMQLNMGKLRAMVEKAGHDSSFEIKTPTAVAAVRGTIYYLTVREASENEVPADIKERLTTDLFVEVGGVLYTNIVSGKYFVVTASLTSGSYGDGTITVPIEVPPDKRPEWTEGWELLVPEAYQSSEGTDLSDLFTSEGGGEGDPRLGDKVNQVVAAAIALYDERDIIWQEMRRKLLEREFLRGEIYEILNEHRERRLEGYMEKIADAQAAKVYTDVHGNRVRVEQYILRPDGPEGKVIELLNVNLRAQNDLTTMAWATTFKQSLDSLPTGELKNLPWNSYLETTYDIRGFPHHIDSPAQDNGIYPTAMSVTLSHANDSFAENKTFAEREPSLERQLISSQSLLVRNFNNDIPMPYALKVRGQQPAGTYSIRGNLRNAEIGGADNNPKGFSYNFTGTRGERGTINSAFYVMSDPLDGSESVRQDGYANVAINGIWDALRVNMNGSDKQISENNLEMVFSSSAFQSGAIDLIYVPFTSPRMDWKDEELH